GALVGLLQARAPREVPEAARHLLEGAEARLEEQAERGRAGRRGPPGRGQGDQRHVLGDQEVAMRPWRVAVRGHSMEPALREGDWVLVFPPRGRPRPGDVVLVRDPQERARLLLKRVAEVRSDGV